MEDTRNNEKTVDELNDVNNSDVSEDEGVVIDSAEDTASVESEDNVEDTPIVENGNIEDNVSDDDEEAGECDADEENDEADESASNDEADADEKLDEADTADEADVAEENNADDEPDEVIGEENTDEDVVNDEVIGDESIDEGAENDEVDGDESIDENVSNDEAIKDETPDETETTDENIEDNSSDENIVKETKAAADEDTVKETKAAPDANATKELKAAKETINNKAAVKPGKTGRKKWWITVVVAVLIVAIVVFLLLVNGKVSVGGTSVSKNAEELTLSAGEFDPAKLAAAIPKLSKLKKISFTDMDMTAEELEAICKAAEGVEVNYTVDVNGQSCDQATQTIDLSGIQADQVPEIAEKLRLLPNLSEVELMSADGSCALAIEDVKQLTDAVPNAKLHYDFDLFGKRISTLDERVVYDGVQIGNEGADEIREALSIMTGCKYLLLDTCGIDNEVMAQIRDEFPDKKIVWRIYLDTGYPFDFLTDEQILRLTYGLNDENSKVLQYCTDVVYLDIGHNEALTDFSCLSNMTELECLIASLASVTDLSPLVNCQKLIWVELIDCYELTDITPLKDIPSIRYLSISETEVSDISATDTLPNLERFGAVKRNIAPEAQERFRQLHPNCIAIFDWDENPYGYGWRYNHGTTFEYYAHMREVFRYDDGGFFGNQKEAVYCPMYLKDVEGYPWYEWQTVVD